MGSKSLKMNNIYYAAIFGIRARKMFTSAIWFALANPKSLDMQLNFVDPAAVDKKMMRDSSIWGHLANADFFVHLEI